MKVKFFLGVLALLGLFVLTGRLVYAQPVTGNPFFELKGTGKLVHLEAPIIFGTKPFVSTINATAIVNCITGIPPPCNTALEIDAGGKGYLIIQDLNTVYLSTHTDCSAATPLTGLVGGNGLFMFSGTHVLSGTEFIVQGKVNFAPAPPNLPFTPVKIINGKIMAVSETREHYATGSFHSVALAGTCP